MIQRFGTKHPDESVVLTFDFRGGLSDDETLSGTPTVSVATKKGVDDTPARS